jgi:hypothetical protein
MSKPLQTLIDGKKADLDRETRELLGQISGLRDDLDEVEEWVKSGPHGWPPSSSVESRAGAVLTNIRDVMLLVRLIRELEEAQSE